MPQTTIGLHLSPLDINTERTALTPNTVFLDVIDVSMSQLVRSTRARTREQRFGRLGVNRACRKLAVDLVDLPQLVCLDLERAPISARLTASSPIISGAKSTRSGVHV